jgi:drug/metabolite transporter (DMT)-like permease
MGLGTMFGGWRIVKTMGQRITKLRPVGGFVRETGGAITLFMATGLGIPVSTTHTITGAIVGVGTRRAQGQRALGRCRQHRLGLDADHSGKRADCRDCFLDRPTGAVSPCQSCGACCASYRVSFPCQEADDQPGGQVPAALVDPVGPHIVCMRGTATAPMRCVALRGTLGSSVSCAIYEFRPSACRDFAPPGDARTWRRGLQRSAPAAWPGGTGRGGGMNQRIVPGAGAFALMVLLCAIWGFQQVAMKFAAAEISPIMQAALRSGLGAVLVFIWARWRGLALFGRDASLRPGLLAGLLFGLEFVFIFVGVERTTVSRMVVFLYTAPCFTVLGLHFFVPGERMAWRQWAGVMLAFAGLVLAFIDKASGGDALGDFFGVLAALFWAATTVLIRATSLARVTATKVLLYQLVVSAAVMFPLSWLVGERGIAVLSAPTLWAMAYQVVIVAFASYLAWFWLLTRYLAGRLLVFSFLTPLFGVGFGMLLMHDQPSLNFFAAAAMVVGGIVLVNLPARK